jgi:hypothetical protein
MVLYRVAWASTWTGRVNHHEPEEEADAHAHLAFLRSRHYFTDYWLERVDAPPAPPPPSGVAPNKPARAGSGLSVTAASERQG